MQKTLAAGALALSLLATPIVAAQAASASDGANASEALAACLYQHATASDKQVLVQWAYVTLSKTSAGKAVQTIPAAKVQSVESSAQKALTNLVVGRCSAARPQGSHEESQERPSGNDDASRREAC